MARIFMLVPALLALSFAPARAGEANVVHLKGGGQIVGRTTDGLLEMLVETPDGEVRVPWSRIDHVDRGSYLRTLYETRAKSIGADDADAHYLLALWCRRQGLADPMRAELGKVLAIQPDHPGARAALGYEKVGEKWVAGEQLLAAKGFVKKDGRWILEEEARFEELAKARQRELSESETKAEDLIPQCVDPKPGVAKFARQTFAAMEWKDVRIPLYRALGDRRSDVRCFAADALARYDQVESVRPLLRTAILDTNEEVRTAAVASLKALREPAALFPMLRALASSNAQIRMNAEQAVGNFGDVRGVEYLIRTLGQNWGPSSRVNMSVMNQVSYIQDFDVEIAQAAQIGDPIVGVLREGVILDVRVVGAGRRMTTVERRLVRGALGKLTGEDKGDDAVAWAKWWKENRARLLADAR